MITETSTLADVAFEVCTALDEAGFVAVLTGGSAATVTTTTKFLTGHLRADANIEKR